MDNKKQKPRQSNNSDLMQYAGMGAQIFVSLGLGVFAGYKLDRWLHFGFPLLVWLLPLIVLSAMIYQLIRQTSKRNKGNDENQI